MKLKQLAETLLASGLTFNPAPALSQTRLLDPGIEAETTITQVMERHPQTQAVSSEHAPTVFVNGKTAQALSEEAKKQLVQRELQAIEDYHSKITYSGDRGGADRLLYDAITLKLSAATIETIMKMGADANKEYGARCGPTNASALDYGVSEGQVASVDAMLKNGAKLPDSEQLAGNALRSGSIGMVQYLQAHKVEIDLKDPGAAVQLLASAKSVQDLKDALKAGVDVNAMSGGYNAVYAHSDYAKSARLAGNSVEDLAPTSETARVEYLLAHGGDPNVGPYGISPLMQVTLFGGNVRLAKALIAHGANVNARDEKGMTPFMWALGGYVESDAINMANLLLENGADVKAVAKEGGTALHYNAMTRSQIVASKLISRGADMNARDSRGLTPAMAVMDNEVYMPAATFFAGPRNEGAYVNFLADQGADLNAKDNHGDTVQYKAWRGAGDSYAADVGTAQLAKDIGDHICGGGGHAMRCSLRGLADAVGLDSLGVLLTPRAQVVAQHAR